MTYTKPTKKGGGMTKGSAPAPRSRLPDEDARQNLAGRATTL
jgi:hypothetical protein